MHSKSGITSKLVKLWHLRMGHMPFNKLRYLFSLIDYSPCNSDFLCTLCPIAKQTRLSFFDSSIKSVHALALLHIDIWGPYKSATHDGHKMFLTIVYDYSRVRWIYLLKHKSEYTSVLDTFLPFVERQFNTKVQCIRNDNAKELSERPALAFYLKHSITHQTGCPDTPQQNGVVERKHRHLLEAA